SLRSRTGRVARSQILADPAGRRLVLLASDCTSAAWSDGAWLAFLRQWGARVPVTVLQLLPEVMWRQTALGQSEGVQLGATVPGAVSPRLRLERETWWLEEDELPTPDLVPVPVISLEPYGLRAWARVMAGVAQARLAGYGFSALDQLESDDEAAVLALDGAALFERFWATASPLARRLAALMAATSVTLPIVRLIQQVMVPRSSTVQVAEVFLSGMLELAAGDVDPERRRYEFVTGVRELLLDTIPRWEALSVIEQVSGFVGRRLGVSLREFEAMVLGEGEEIVDEGVEAFAEVTVGVLQHLGYGIQSPSSVSSKVKQAFSPTADDISNEQKNNITVLATLLQEKRWEEANLETSRILLNLFPGFRYKELDKKDSLWNEVDRVWSQYSDGKFGFSSQRKLLDNLINPNSDLDIVKSYICSQLGWLRDNAFLTYGEINFSIDAPEGHLPIIIDTRWKNLEFMTRWLCLNAPIVSEENFHTYFVNILISCIYFSVEVFKHFELIRSKAESERGISIDLESLLSQNYLNELALRSLDSLSPSTEIDDDRNKEDPLRSIAIASSRNTLEIKYDQLNKYEREEFFVLARDIYMYLKSWLMKSIKYNRPMDYRLIEIRVKKKDNLVNALDYSRKILMDSAGVNELYRVYTQDKKAIDSAKKIVDKYMEYLILGIKSLDL
ncbi:MAG: SAV_2336 N-terminal domain-related protein, partial [Spirulinaceae cyanobacterium]